MQDATPNDVPSPLVSARRDYVSGTPCFHGTRVPVDTLFQYLAAGYDIHEFIAQYPSVTLEHARRVVEHAHELVVAAAPSDVGS